MRRSPASRLISAEASRCAGHTGRKKRGPSRISSDGSRARSLNSDGFWIARTSRDSWANGSRRIPCAPRARPLCRRRRAWRRSARLRPLKVAPADLALRLRVSIGPTGVVWHDGHPYSMAPDAIALRGTLYLYRERVRIVAGRFGAEHERRFQPGEGSILPEHRAARVAAVSGKRARRYLQRQHLMDLGPAALAYLTELTHRRPQRWIADVEQLHDLLQRHGDAALRAALDRGVAEHAIGAEYIAHYLGDPAPPLPFDGPDRPSTIAASVLPRAGRVQGAVGARRGGAQRSPWTRPSTAVRSSGVGGRS
jgi:hypothetical protein